MSPKKIWLSTEEIPELLNRLDVFYNDLKVPLRHRSAFELLVAVILSAQCTDERVNKVTLSIFPKDRALTPKDLLDLGEDGLRGKIRSISYPNTKTKALMRTAQEIEILGSVPGDFESLRALPGVGPKTAQVVLAQWFGQDTFPVDTHVHRTSNRLGLANSGTNRDLTERQVKQRVPKEKWSKLHLQLIYHGRAVCTARKPKCLECPLRDLCPSFPNPNS